MASQGMDAQRQPGIPPAPAGKPGGPLRPAPGPTELPPTTIRDRLVLLLTNGMSVEAAEGYCIRQGGMDLDAARRTVADARQRITIAADFARDEQLGKAVMRLDDLYAKSITAQDTRTALQAQRELNRLLGLYSPKDTADGEAPTDAQEALQRLELIASYLLPLKLTDERYPVEEHARLASEIIRTRGV
jgi:hypothetical protein